MSKKGKNTRTKRFIDKSKVEQYDYHLPVMYREVIENLFIDTGGIYIDGTLGGGGHAAKILDKLDSGGKLIAFDKDIDAIEHCKRKYNQYIATGQFHLYNECYSKASSVVEAWGKISGILLDLGVSSRQLDTDSRGLSYRVNSRLDMRFGEKGISAEELINFATEHELERILRDYGEEPFYRQIVRRIVERRRTSPFKTTFDLREFIEEIVPEQHHFKTLSRVFQAFRIAANNELSVLEDGLNSILPFMAKGGRIVVISYHSLEDRIVKEFFKANEYIAPKNKYKIEEHEIQTGNKLKILTKKPLTPSKEELEANPRSRSAKTRVAEII